MSESSQQIWSRPDGSAKSLDSNGDLPPLVKVWDADDPKELEKQRDKLNREVTATALHIRATNASI